MIHHPRKRFGQNFLHDQNVIQNIIQLFHPQPEDNVVEIGPGLGALTQFLLKTVHFFTAIEIDRDLQAHLKQRFITKNWHLIEADALTVNYSELGQRLRVIGNLPYNISTPLLFHLLQHASHIEDMHFMLQKEVVERLAAQPGSKAYGRLSVMVQYQCDVEQLLLVPPSAFHPPPKVESAVVRLSPYSVSPYPSVPIAQLEHLLSCAFSMRRKTIANNLKKIISPQDLMTLDIDPSMRPEQISITDYAQIAKFINN